MMAEDHVHVTLMVTTVATISSMWHLAVIETVSSYDNLQSVEGKFGSGAPSHINTGQYVDMNGTFP